jgi:hypothetical protein
MIKPNFVEKGAERYVRGKTEQFDEKFIMPTNFGRIDDILIHSSEHPRKNAHKA